ncbi:bifunctional biotin--[acetyl-CoA-carboxylase] synthetase/biotin operon repressor [Paenibacillus sp. UNC451MF]|uniref:bifunctional biotin--[acetyl-CoA-carboxylase] synthetase/biotin operon repressor n=1 Tax=Paenibacillus sp. UNC451MF TaxID=1449063 RepID=UPI000564AF96|nr:bifunctional biotin--[acetyl-CoA-carboxylase] synthetase/biotin operon repressor [Paenibacillus sp. UNC451MF]
MTINEQLIQMFEERPQQFLSGEELSTKLNCSRTAIWKHIERLRQEGYEFEAVSRKGYRLMSKPEKLNIQEILQRLETSTLGKSIHYYDEVDSTQTVARELITQGAEEGTLVIAELQTAGRGRLGRRWHSPKGKGLWMSLVLKPRIPVQFTPQLTLLIAVALCRALRQITSLSIGIKWPNDLLIEGKKISGILLESSAEDENLQYVVAGIGISVNLAQDDYPDDELRSKATSLSIEAGKKLDRTDILCQFLRELELVYTLYHEQGFGPIKLLWEALSVSLHRSITCQTPRGVSEGYAVGIDDSGALTVRLPDGSMTQWYSGDIQFANPVAD